MLNRATICLAGALIALPAFAAPAFTIPQVLSAPFPQDLVASPKGDAFAWVQDAEGNRSLWIARAPDWRAASIAQFDGDDGQELSSLVWKPDASAVFFVRGSGPNSRGEIANPRSVANGAQQEIWIAPLSGDAHKVGNGRGPAVSPDGSVLAWVLGGQVWSARLVASGPSERPAQLFTARGFASDLHWSPDSHRLAFVSDRGDHNFIGIFDVAKRAVSFLDPSVDTDQYPTWSPDGSEVAFIRIPAMPSVFDHAPARSGPPWSIRIADAVTGEAREVWSADEGPGSMFREDVSPTQLIWLANGRIAFPWEKEGWLHLYSIPSSGGSATLLTPGAFEIETVTVSPNRRAMVYSSNQDDSERRHLWRVAQEGAAPQLLTPGTGLEWLPAVAADGHIAFIHSDAKHPARAALLDPGGAIHDLTPQTMPANFPADALVEPKSVSFAAADGMTIQGQLFLPPNATAGKHPAVVFFHGGPRREMLLGWHSMSYYHQAYGVNQYLASRGYVVLAINFRSGIGYGLNFREALAYGASGGSEYNDVLGAGRFLAGRPDVDAKRIGAWGGSYGGYLTALALARASDLFAVGVDFHGVHDWSTELTNYPGDLARKEELKKIAFEASPMAYLKTWRSPVLIIQGDDDRNVQFNQSVLMVEALRKQGVPLEQLVLPDEVHEFAVHADWLKAYAATVEFLDRYLKP